jgi:hypothetical protein
LTTTFPGNQVQDEPETPERVFEPIKVLLPAFFGPIPGPARALERIVAQVGDARRVAMGRFTRPSTVLVECA